MAHRESACRYILIPLPFSAIFEKVGLMVSRLHLFLVVRFDLRWNVVEDKKWDESHFAIFAASLPSP